MLDLGDLHLEDACWDEASAAYAEALAREPDGAWARTRGAYARFRVPLREAWLRLPSVDPALRITLECELAQRLHDA